MRQHACASCLRLHFSDPDRLAFTQCMPCLLGALCCLVPASAHWRRQLNKIAHDGRDAFAKIHVDPVPYDQQRHEAQQRAQYQQEYNSLAQVCSLLLQHILFRPVFVFLCYMVKVGWLDSLRFSHSHGFLIL